MFIVVECAHCKIPFSTIKELLRQGVVCPHCSRKVFLKNENDGDESSSLSNVSENSNSLYGVVILLAIVAFLFSAVSTCNTEPDNARIKSNFNSWDGSHINLVQTIKKNMHDPSSFKHVSTSYIESGDHLIVKMTFRGKNTFGAIVTNTAVAKADLDGNVLEVIDYGY